jgi:hypothetical protein
VYVERRLQFPDGQGTNHFVPQTAQAVTSFSDPTAKERRFAGDRNALW